MSDIIYKRFYDSSEDGLNVKFTIYETLENRVFFYAKVIITDLDIYKILSDFEKNDHPGVVIIDKNRQRVLYSNADELISDLKKDFFTKDFYFTSKL